MKDDKINPEKAKQEQKQSADPANVTNGLGAIVQSIAGESKLADTLRKIILGPVGILAALGGIGYLLYQNNRQRRRISQLEKENERLRESVDDLEDDDEDLNGRTGRHRRLLTQKDEEDYYLGDENIPAWRRPKKPGNRSNTLYID